MPNATIPSIPGVVAPPDVAKGLGSAVAKLLHRHADTFPGSQPVSFTARHIEKLKTEKYYVCEKSDGIRCLLYLTHEQGSEICYFIDRRNEFYFPGPMHFPRHDDPSFQQYHTDTLVDGELVLDDAGTSTERMRYLVFDCLAVDGKLLVDRTLDKRLAYFKELVYVPYDRLLQKYPEEESHMPFSVAFKDMQFAYGIGKMFDEIIPKLKHDNDGLIFTAVDRPYTFGTDENILKWKPANENSVDFKLYLDFPTKEDEAGDLIADYTLKPTFHLAMWQGGERYKVVGEAYVPEEQYHEFEESTSGIDELVVECAKDEEKRWRILRFRTDKANGNHESVVEKIQESIEDGITKEQLILVQGEVRSGWKTRESISE